MQKNIWNPDHHEPFQNLALLNKITLNFKITFK